MGLSGSWQFCHRTISILQASQNDLNNDLMSLNVLYKSEIFVRIISIFPNEKIRNYFNRFQSTSGEFNKGVDD